MSAVLGLLLPHIGRWEDVEILSDTWEPLNLFLKSCSRTGSEGISDDYGETKLKAGILRRMALSRCNAYFTLDGARFSPASMKTFFAPFSSAPLLHDITLAGVHLAWGNLRLQNLTQFSLKYHARYVLPTPSELIAILASSPNLEILSILGWGVRSFDSVLSLSDLEGSIVVRNLREFTLGWVDVQHSLKLLSLFSFQMPKLRMLALEDVANSLDPISTQESSAILDFLLSKLSENTDSLSTPYVDIKELSLHSVNGPVSCCHRFLGGFRSIETLTLHSVESSFLSALCPSHGDIKDKPEMLCPKLSHVVIRDVDGVSPSMVNHFLDARERYWATANSGIGSAEITTASVTVEIENLYDLEDEAEDIESDGLSNFEDDYPTDAAHFIDGSIHAVDGDYNLSVGTNEDDYTASLRAGVDVRSCGLFGKLYPADKLKYNDVHSYSMLPRKSIPHTTVRSDAMKWENRRWSIAGVNPQRELNREGS
ncbi:hypothetical protein M0805_006921 [Coniferiporia weirii]|nr:hypothetical protein M0805_006921 [Coniferiporia weirii]